MAQYLPWQRRRRGGRRGTRGPRRAAAPSLAHVHEVNPLVAIVATVQQKIAASRQTVGEAGILEEEHGLPPLVAAFFLNPRNRAPPWHSVPLHPAGTIVAQAPGVGAAIQIGDGDGDGVGTVEEIVVFYLEEHVRIACRLVCTADGPRFPPGRQGRIVRMVVVSHRGDGGIVGLGNGAPPSDVIVLFQPEVVVAPLRIVVGAWRCLPARLPGIAVFAHGHPDAGSILQRRTDVGPYPLEDVYVLDPVRPPVWRERLLVEEILVEAQIGRMLVQTVEHAPVHLSGIAEHVLISLVGCRQHLIVQQHQIMYSTVTTTVVPSKHRAFLIRVQGVEREAHALADRMEANFPPFTGPEGIGGRLHHEHPVQLAILAEGIHVPINDLVDGLDP